MLPLLPKVQKAQILVGIYRMKEYRVGLLRWLSEPCKDTRYVIIPCYQRFFILSLLFAGLFTAVFQDKKKIALLVGYEATDLVRRLITS